MYKRKFFALAIAASACGNGTPTNFAGTYTATIVNDSAVCLPNWQAGNSSSNIPVMMTQSDTVGQLTVTGVAGLVVAAYVGTATFPGTVQGNTFTANALGTKSANQGACTYTVNTKLNVSIDSNNVISGTIVYTPATNGDASCGALNSCTNSETVSGSRTGN